MWYKIHNLEQILENYEENKDELFAYLELKEQKKVMDYIKK